MADSEERVLDVDPDTLIARIAEYNEEDKDRAQSAASTRSKIKVYLEETGMNAKALSLLRFLDKQAPERRADILRSLRKGLEIMEERWRGQNSEEFDFGPEDPDAPEDDYGVYGGDTTEIGPETVIPFDPSADDANGIQIEGSIA